MAQYQLPEAERAALVERVLAEMAEGKTLKEAVEERNALVVGVKYGKPGCVTPGQVRQWVVDEPEWFGRYQRTRRLMGQAFAEEAIQVARKSTTHSTATDRVLIETLKWAAAKTNPLEYGEKTTVEHQGAPTLKIQIVEEDGVVRNPEALTNGEKAQVVSAIASAEPLLLSAPMYMPESGKPADDEDIDWSAPEQSPRNAPKSVRKPK